MISSFIGCPWFFNMHSTCMLITVYTFFPDTTRTLAHPEFHHTPYVLLLYSILLALYFHIFQIISILCIQCTFRFNPMLTMSFLHIPSYILLLLSEFEFLLPKVYPSIILSERVFWWHTSVFIWKQFYLNRYLRQSRGHALSPIVCSEVWPWTKTYGPGFSARQPYVLCSSPCCDRVIPS